MKTKIHPTCEYCGNPFKQSQLICIPSPIGTSRGECAECFCKRHNFTEEISKDIIKQIGGK